MVKLSSYGIYKCKDITSYATLTHLLFVTGKNILKELKNLDFTPYIDTKDLKYISKVDIRNKLLNMLPIMLTNKITGRSRTLSPDNFYLVRCDKTRCKNYNICN